MKSEGIVVLSLFDGISAAMVALERAGIKVKKYYASEIDVHAIAISSYNYGKIIQMGDIENWQDWNDEYGNAFDFSKVDLVIGGSPCTNLSNAGNGQGLKGLQSRLFYTFVRIWKQVKLQNPSAYVLLENVKMKKEWMDEMSRIMEIEPIVIDSALVSAQRRLRVYWTNIPNVSQPEDKKVFLRDVVLWDALPVVIHNVYGGFGETSVRTFTGKSPTIRANSGGGSIPSFIKRSALVLSQKGMIYMNRVVKDGRTHWDFAHHSDINDEKSATVVSNWAKGVPYNVLRDIDCVREFHPVETERLQTFSDDFSRFGLYQKKDGTYQIKEVSKTQRLKALGNSFTVDVIAHILSGIKD